MSILHLRRRSVKTNRRQLKAMRKKKYQILSINSRKIKGKKSQRCFPVVIFTLSIILPGFISFFLDQNLVGIPVIPHSGNRKKKLSTPNLPHTFNIL